MMRILLYARRRLRDLARRHEVRTSPESTSFGIECLLMSPSEETDGKKRQKRRNFLYAGNFDNRTLSGGCDEKLFKPFGVVCGPRALPIPAPFEGAGIPAPFF